MALLVSAEALAKEDNREQGKVLYLKHCEICHGPEGKGDGYTLFNPPVADLTSEYVQRKTDTSLWNSIHRGVRNTGMGMWRFVLTEEDIDMVLAYVRSLKS